MQLNPKISKFIQQQHVLSLSVILPDQQPWACNAFYVFDQDLLNLYLLSELKTVHAKAMLNNPMVAGTICLTPKSVAQIQGVQFQAIASQLTGQAADCAYQLYYQAFPFARIIKAPIWSLQLQQIKMTNNLIGFAHKTYWQRDRGDLDN
ncbi:hypothetical protein A9G13_02670 [Gilliamella sp. wkB178]|uniref:pyridoxamine 5'-phosphate oxidase family protein n=1 Tax=Gilliamella sp. wkB178 TaxID=3120259 RepID=UPI00080E56B0|nr:pyridoxamine 5'-phosphate oxidase family protein [Gilliamella apicola]OCG08978.1 hypothetical protein A9G13_02670 [Gilliamella apicola]